jgi:hypothetical protein
MSSLRLIQWYHSRADLIWGLVHLMCMWQSLRKAVTALQILCEKTCVSRFKNEENSRRRYTYQSLNAGYTTTTFDLMRQPFNNLKPK